METATKGMTGPVEYFRTQLEYELTPAGLKALLEAPTNNVLVLDVRDAAQFDAGHVPGARYVQQEKKNNTNNDQPKDRTIVIYCGDVTCGLPLWAALELAQEGFSAKYLHGGFAEWEKQSLPVESSPPPPEPEY